MWTERWIGGTTLQEEFPRLFQLEDKDACIADRGAWYHEDWKWNWSWRRDPRGREIGEFEALSSRLTGIAPVRDRVDKVEWLLDGGKEYSVKRMKEIYDDGDVNPNRQTIKTIWSVGIPKKVAIFIWRARRGRIPCRETLDKMGIDLDSLLCPRCGDAIESPDHALVSCPEVKELWVTLGKWWKRSTERVSTLQEALQEVGSSSDRGANSLWSNVKWAFLYLVWAQRNSIVFTRSNKRVREKWPEWQRIILDWVLGRSTKVELGPYISGVVDPNGAADAATAADG